MGVRLKEMWQDAISDADKADNVVPGGIGHSLSPRAPPCPPSRAPPPGPPLSLTTPVIWMAGKAGGEGCTLIGQLPPPYLSSPHASHPPPSPLICFPGNAFFVWAAYYLQDNNIIIIKHHSPPLPQLSPQTPRATIPFF